MNKGQLYKVLDKFPDDSEVLIFAEKIEGVTESGENITQNEGIAVFDGKILHFLGECEVVKILEPDSQYPIYEA